MSFIKITIFTALSFASQVAMAESKFMLLYDDVQNHLEVIDDKEEREIISLYLKYLKSGLAKDGKLVTERIKKLSVKRKRPISTSNISLFEGAADFCGRKTRFENCSYTTGSATDEKLRPLLRAGNETAIELVLIYSGAVSLDGAEATSIQEYQELIRTEFPDKLKKIQLKNKAFFKARPINWVEGG
ncbi:hypothetical protein AZI87_00850 [Bdellovibrio bacteriovorus]|uniref:Uncharacterized protein n=1 Tax=Bdellovibrio bacteriovorus TaxID=959 RepID=A0A162GD80_BDEBC|nr:hypothetical protein [Bdellovibrio bacteriovorus]KYG67859.1 hypothetical protein AZI87_00850 [Bdellovibrio bacteriovorus]